MKAKGFLLLLTTFILFRHVPVAAQNLASSWDIGSTGESEMSYLHKLRTVRINLFDSLKNEGMMPMNTFWKGAGVGFGIGGSIGIGFGLLGEDWVLSDGTIVPRWQHALVDMFIFAAPFVAMGGVVGVRQPRPTLEPSRLHVAVAGGYSTVMTYRSIKDAFRASGIDGEIPHWFGYLHYPNGAETSTPYTWNLTADYNLTKHISVGLSFNNIVKQEVNEAGHTHDEKEEGNIGVNEWTKGEVYTVLADYVINPITPENKTRIEVAVGAGIGFQNLLIGGSFENVKPDFKFREQVFTPYFRTTFDYYSRRTLSLQLKFGYRPKKNVFVPERTNGEETVEAHDINYRALEMTVGIRRHFKL